MTDQLEIVGVVIEEVGSPRNDGSPGSGLYAVPIKLSRAPDYLERRLLVETWDRPPRLTSMHRPGIMRIVGDRMVLDGTTIEEVADVHSKTLRLVLSRVNRAAAEIRSRTESERLQREADEKAHKRHVADVADKIKF